MLETIAFLNTFLITPSVIVRKNQKQRATQLLPFILNNANRPSIIGLAEVFRGYCKRMGNEAEEYGYEYICPGGGVLQSSGLMLLYDPNIWELLVHAKEKFRKCSGTDCLSSKGFLATELLHKPTGRVIYFIVTHLNANQNKSIKASKIQKIQLDHIKDFIQNELPPDAPIIIMGDFNIDIDQDPRFLVNSVATLGDLGNPTDFTTNVWSDQGEELLDYIITKNIPRISHSSNTI